MPAPLKVTDPQVREAWERWGSVSAAAAALGIARGSLDKRLKDLGIGPSMAAKGAEASSMTMEAKDTKAAPVGGGRTLAGMSPPPSTRVPEKSPAIYPRATPKPIVRDVQSAAADREEAALPIRTLKPRAVQPIRIDLPNQKRIVEWTQRLAEAFGAETDPTLIANQVLEEVLDEWGEAKLKLAQRRPRKRGGDSE